MSEGPPVDFRYMPSEVRKQIEEAGFTDVNISEELEKDFLITART